MLLASLLGQCRTLGVAVRPTAFAFGARAFRPGSAAPPHVAPVASASASASTAPPWGQRRRSSRLSSSSISTRLRSTTDGGRPAEEQVAATAVVAGSTEEEEGEEEGAPSSSAAPALKLKKRQRRTVTGGLKNLPIALPAVELLNRALRAAKYLKVRGLVGLSMLLPRSQHVTQSQLLESTPPCPLPLAPATQTPPIHARSTRTR